MKHGQMLEWTCEPPWKRQSPRIPHPHNAKQNCAKTPELRALGIVLSITGCFRLGQRAQVDFAHFKVVFADEPQQVRVVWLFCLVLGHSRYLFARFCLQQDLQTLLRLHIEAFEHLQGVPREILYYRMKTAVLGEGEDEHIVYNRALLALVSRPLRLQPAGMQGLPGFRPSRHPVPRSSCPV